MAQLIVMPVMGGKELADRLRAVRPEIRILFMSGYAENLNLRQDISEPKIQFLQKPCSSSILTQKVREMLDSTPSTTP